MCVTRFACGADAPASWPSPVSRSGSAWRDDHDVQRGEPCGELRARLRRRRPARRALEHEPRAGHPRAAAELGDRSAPSLEHGPPFESFGFFQGNGAPVTLAGPRPRRAASSQMPVDVNALSIVGVKPLLGRTYRLEDFDDVVKQKEARAIVISYDTWQRRLGGIAGRHRHDRSTWTASRGRSSASCRRASRWCRGRTASPSGPRTICAGFPRRAG